MATTLNLVTQLATAEFWYVHSEGATFGPFTPGQMDELGNQGRLGPTSMVVPAGDTNWVALGSLLPALQTIRTPTSAELSALIGVTPSAATITNQGAASVDVSAHAPMTFESLTRSLPQTSAGPRASPSISPNTGCSICGSTPARPFVFAQSIGMLWAHREKTLTGTYCRSCAQARGRKTQSHTILTGWWGWASSGANYVFVFYNGLALWEASRLEKPKSKNNPERLSPGLPVIFRPATLVLPALGGLIYFYKIRTVGEP
jgi:GYF domain 2